MSDLTPQQAQLLLEKLSTDDTFRAALSVNAEAALKQAGLPVTLGACMATKRALPTKQAAQAALGTLNKQRASLMSQDVHNLMAD